MDTQGKVQSKNKYRCLTGLFTNKYFLITVAFLVWILFFDETSIIKQLSYFSQINSMKQKITHYNSEIERMKKTIELLYKDKNYLMRFAITSFFYAGKDDEVIILRQKNKVQQRK